MVDVAQHEDAARLASLIENTGDDVAILSNDELAHWPGTFGKDRRAEAVGQLECFITTAGRGGCARLSSTGDRYGDRERD